MADDPCSPQGWTIDTLKEHLTSRLDGLKENVSTAMMAADKAISKAEVAVEKRFESVNEFRESLDDMVQTLLPRSEYDVQHKALVEKVTDLGQRLLVIETTRTTKREGLSTTNVIFIGMCAGVTAACALGSFIFFLVRGH